MSELNERKNNKKINNENTNNEKIEKNKEKVEKNKEKNIKIKLEKIRCKFLEYYKKNSLITYIIIGIALFFLSVLLVAQMKTVSDSEAVLQGKRESELADELVTLQRNYDNLKAEYEQSQKVVEEYKSSSSTNNTLINSMKDEIENLSTVAGTTDLKGQGIVITLTDAAQNPNTVDTDSLVHDSDVLTVVNELKAAGAEAISVNGQRIISTSAIRCVGPVIQVNYQKVSTPIVINAIGNAQWLESAMNIKNGVVDTLRQTTGIGVTVERKDEVKIPKYDGTLTFQNAVEDN